jgi:hypothetical protein
MPEPTRTREIYLATLQARLTGSHRARRRLLTELRDHLEDALGRQLETGLHPEAAEQRALEQLGSPADLARAWETRCARLRKRQRRRLSLLALAAALASVLALTQHADGRRDPAGPSRPCPTAAAPTAEDCPRH